MVLVTKASVSLRAAALELVYEARGGGKPLERDVDLRACGGGVITIRVTPEKGVEFTIK